MTHSATPVGPAQPAPPTLPKVEAQGLYKHFTAAGRRSEILADISFTINSGEFVAVVGASGCGKTTLLRIIDGIETATRGKVCVNGVETKGTGRDRGLVFQQDNLFPWRTVQRNVTLGLELQGRSRAERVAQAQKYINLVGLPGFEKHYPHQLSGGMRQRVNIARALAISPEIFLLDEPFASLDSQTREIMQLELLRIWSDAAGARTVMFVTHQIDEAIFLSDRVFVMTARPGRLKEIVDVPFERPRDLRIKRSAEFGAIHDRIWDAIENEVRASMRPSLD